MVLILICWLYLFFTSIAFGIGFSKLFRIQTTNIVYTSILGLLGVTLLACIWAIFGPINIGFHAFLLSIATLILWLNKDYFNSIIKKEQSQWKDFSSFLKLFVIVGSILVLAQSVALPLIIDNETYYIQTIKWLNEYGLVPGLANLHLFLGQTSGWHITQSVYSFSFLGDQFNDINGYLLLLANYWALQKLHSYFLFRNKTDLIFGLLPIAYPFLFLFISAPSPDLPVYLIGFIVFSLYLDEDIEHFKMITALGLFAAFIKITAVVLLIFPLLLTIKYFKILVKSLPSMSLLGGLVLVLFVAKNSILTGYPLYPLPLFPSNENYLVPNEVMTYFFSKDSMHSFYMPYGSFQNATLVEILKHYFLYNGIDSIIGLVSLVIILLSPFIIAKYSPKQRLFNIFFVFIVWMILLAFSSPQFRFYVYFPLFFGLVLMSILFQKRKAIIGLLSFGLLASTIFVFVPMSYGNLITTKAMTSNSSFEFKNLLVPKEISKNDRGLSSQIKGNLKYYSPIEYNFFWITGNTDLPCVNKEQLDYFETNFHIIPQLRSKTFKEGFYAKKTTND